MAALIFLMVILISSIDVLMSQCAMPEQCYFHYTRHVDMKEEKLYRFSGAISSDSTENQGNNDSI